MSECIAILMYNRNGFALKVYQVLIFVYFYLVDLKGQKSLNNKSKVSYMNLKFFGAFVWVF